MPKLTELKGAENLPKEKPRVKAGEIANLVIHGHNSAVSQLESCGIKVNVEKLAQFFNDNNAKWYEQCQYSDEPDLGTLMAQALAASAGDYLEIEVIK